MVEYVMVPVPEEILAEVQSFLAWDVRGKQARPDNPDAILEVYAAADSSLRTVLMTVATASLDGKRLPVREVADAAGITVHEFVGLMTECNYHLHAAGGGLAAMMSRPDPQPLAEGAPEWEHRVVHMSDEIAEKIVAL